MKKSILVATILFATVASVAQAQDPEGLALMKKSDCFTCHRVPTKLIGPAYKDVAAKYKGADDAKVTELANKVVKGGVGVWGNVAMKGHPEIPLENAKKMVQWILALADAPAPGAAPAAPAAPATPAPATN